MPLTGARREQLRSQRSSRPVRKRREVSLDIPSAFPARKTPTSHLPAVIGPASRSAHFSALLATAACCQDVEMEPAPDFDEYSRSSCADVVGQQTSGGHAFSACRSRSRSRVFDRSEQQQSRSRSRERRGEPSSAAPAMAAKEHPVPMEEQEDSGRRGREDERRSSAPQRRAVSRSRSRSLVRCTRRLRSRSVERGRVGVPQVVVSSSPVQHQHCEAPPLFAPGCGSPEPTTAHHHHGDQHACRRAERRRRPRHPVAAAGRGGASIPLDTHFLSVADMGAELASLALHDGDPAATSSMMLVDFSEEDSGLPTPPFVADDVPVSAPAPAMTTTAGDAATAESANVGVDDRPTNIGDSTNDFGAGVIGRREEGSASDVLEGDFVLVLCRRSGSVEEFVVVGGGGDGKGIVFVFVFVRFCFCCCFVFVLERFRTTVFVGV